LSETIPSGAVDQLKSTINVDGGWGWVAGSSDTNGTALALQALVAAGESLSATEVISGLAYLDAAQNSDGGFPYDPASLTTTESDANSTAYVVQALMATSQDPFTGTWLISDTHPISYLLSLQLANGSFEWQAGSGTNQLATQQAIPALLGRPYPLRINPNLETCPARFLPVITKN
jgi:prenyltransferase beta subunit